MYFDRDISSNAEALVAVLLAFWLGTGLFVKREVQPAVPFSTPLPSVGGR